MTKSDVKSRAIVLLTALLLLFSLIISFQSLHRLQSHERVMYYTGVVRSATQRLVKQELTDNPNDMLITRLDEIMIQLQTGEGPDHIVPLDDGDFRRRLSILQSVWNSLKSEIQKYRADGSRDGLTVLSEIYYTECDTTLETAKASYTRTAAALRNSLVLLTCVLLAAACAAIWISSHRLRAHLRAQAELRELDNDLDGGFLRVADDPCRTIEHISGGLLRLLGYTRKDVDVRFHNHFISIIYNEDRDRVRRELEERLEKDGRFELEYRVEKSDGSVAWVLDKGRRMEERGGRAVLHSLLINMTESKNTMHDLLLNEERYAIILDQTQDVVFEWDVKNDLMYHSSNFERKFGYQPPSHFFFDALRESPFIPEEDKARFFAACDRLKKGARYQEVEYRLKTAQGPFLWCRTKITMLFDEKDTPVRMVGILTDIDAEKRKTLSLEARAQCDSLTGLYNKMTTRALVENCLNDLPKSLHALFVVDIDNFKELNDTLGHLFGDAVLSEMASRMKRHFRAEDVIGRIGGDEFVIFLRDIPTEDLILQKAAVIGSAFRQSFAGVQENHRITCSIGISVHPRDGGTFDALFRRADVALYGAKRKGKDQFCIYSEALERDAALQKYEPRTNRIESEKTRPNFTRYIFDILYEATDTESAINGILDLTARYYHVSHAYLYRAAAPGGPWRKSFEWCADPAYAFPCETEALRPAMPEDADLYDADGVLYCTDLSHLPERPAAFFREAGVHSILQTLVMENGVCMGCVGFCEHVDDRFWTRDEVDASIYISKTITLFLLNKRAQEKEMASGRAAQFILDQMDVRSYVVDSERRLVYLNKMAQKSAGDAVIGQPCHEALRGSAGPCAGCPLARVGAGAPRVTAEVFDKASHVWVEVTAAGVHWLDGADAFLITCRDLPGRTPPPEHAGTE